MRVTNIAISTFLVACIFGTTALAFQVGGQDVGGVVGGAGDSIGGAVSDAWKDIIPETNECVAFVGSNQAAFGATVKAIQQNKGRLKAEHGVDSPGSCTQKSGDVAKFIAAKQGVTKALLTAAWMKCACEKAY
jgi:hypothetical protein